MRSIGYGDMALSYSNMLQNARLRSDLSRLGEELATGVQSDLKSATNGDLRSYASLESSLASLSAYRSVGQEVSLYAETLQSTLGAVQDVTSTVAPQLVQGGNSQTATIVDAVAADARANFLTIVSQLNVRVADRALLAGTAYDGPVSLDGETMLAEIATAVSVQPNAAGVDAAIDDWFDLAGGGFETLGYLGGTTDVDPFRIGADERVTLQIRADDQALRDVMKNLAKAAVLNEGTLAGLTQERAELMALAGEGLINANASLVDLRSGLGTVEAQLERALVQNASETSALELARANIRQVDQYDVAGQFQAAEVQLETLYTITARLARLSLVDYLS